VALARRVDDVGHDVVGPRRDPGLDGVAGAPDADGVPAVAQVADGGDDAGRSGDGRLGRRGHQRTPPLSPTTIRYAYIILRIALGRALKLGRVHRNVATLIDRPAQARHELQPMSAKQARTLLGSVAGDRLEAPYRLAIASGLRQGELLGLRW
jgi:integrase